MTAADLIRELTRRPNHTVILAGGKLALDGHEGRTSVGTPVTTCRLIARTLPGGQAERLSGAEVCRRCLGDGCPVCDWTGG